jgi:VanZ family protein
MQQKLVAGAAWACLAFVTYATLSHPDARPSLTSSEPFQIVLLERVGAYGLVGSLFCIAYPRRTTLVCILVIGTAVLLECLQIFIPGRDARVTDALEKIAGGAIGISVAKAFLTYRNHLPPSSGKSDARL